MRWLVALVLCAGLCTVLDHQHVTWGVLWYRHPDVWQQAWWVPLLFFTGGVGALYSTGVVRRVVGGGEGTRPRLAQVAVDVASFATAYYLTAVAHHVPDILTAILAGAWVVRAVSGLPGWAVAYCIGTAMVGPAVESAVSSLGGFYYHDPDFLGVTRWLPALYLHVGVVSVTLSEWLRRREPVEAIEIEVVV
jgi:hypothetical protein